MSQKITDVKPSRHRVSLQCVQEMPMGTRRPHRSVGLSRAPTVVAIEHPPRSETTMTETHELDVINEALAIIDKGLGDMTQS